MNVLFKDMTREQKIAHIEKCCAEAREDFLADNPAPLADIIDVWDYWIPWLLAEVKGGQN